MFSALINRFRPSLGWRISGWYAAGFIGSFVLIGLFASWLTRDGGRRADRAEIMGEFNKDAAHCRQVGSEAFRAETAQEQPDVDITLVRLSDLANHTMLLVPSFGESISETARAERRLQRDRTRGWRLLAGDAGGDETWQVYAESMPDGTWLQVAKSDRRGHETRQRLQTVLPLAALLMLLLALAGAAALTTHALRPIRRLIETTRAVIQSGDMTARVPARAGGGDELDELNALFNQMLSRNESLIRGMTEALDHVAHDLRTPLTRLRGSAESALRDPMPTLLTRGDALSDAVEESERVLAILRVILDISGAEHGAMSLELAPVPLAELAAAAIDLYEYVAEARDVRVSMDVSPELRVWADRTRLQQVIANLLDNALKYSGPGGEVRIEAGREDGGHRQVWLRMRDRGTGIAPHDLPRIWDRLYRGDRSRSQPGSGLGLSLVKAILQAHGGRVEVTSEPGEGSNFTVFLPAESE